MKDINFSLDLGIRTDYLMQQQALTGVFFDQKKALELYEYCEQDMKRIEGEVEPHLPEKPLNKGELAKVTPPDTSPIKTKAGHINKRLTNWWDSIRVEESDYMGEKVETFYGTKEGKEFRLPYNSPIRTNGKMHLSNQKEMKNWLMELGWKPTLWNFKKDANNKFIREKGQLIKTSPKFHDKGELCPNLEALGEVVDIIKPVVRWLSLRNRKSVIWNPDKETGWLANDRLNLDGRLPAGSSSITNTLRQKHAIVANIPRVSSTLGKEMRSLFTAPKGKVMVGYDASGIEARVEGHWVYTYQHGKEHAEELIDGDVHTKSALAFFPDKVILDEKGRATDVTRSPSKNGRYALMYGAQVKKLAETLNISIDAAQEAYDSFWKTNLPLKQFKDKLTTHWKSKGSNKIHCHLTGSVLYSRSEHSLVNLVFQHTGAIIMDLSGALMDKWLGGLKDDKNGLPYYNYKGFEVRRVIYYHDEMQFECDPEIADEIGKMGVRSIIKAGELLGLNVPLDADFDIGQSWADTH